ncbi:MAG: response regulator [Acidimicrobiia bacterium]
MNELREFYLASLGPQIEALEVALASLEEGQREAGDSIRRVAHQLKGSGASYGFPEVTDRAKEVLAASDRDLCEATRLLIDLLMELSSDTGGLVQTVLVVDDDPVIQVLLQKALETPGREILLASTMAEGREHLRAEPDLIVLDLFLPDGDGRQLLTDIRRDPATADMTVIVLSGADSGVAKAECLALGADAFLAKPFEPISLNPLVESLLQADATADRHGVTAVVPAPEEPAEPTEPAGPQSVLLAEDDDLVAALIVDRLSRDGFEMVHCTDGESALAEATRNPPDLAILDVKMPKMDGFELLSHFREIPALAELPVIVLTAMGSEHDVVRGFDLGADDYVLKPFSPTELAARVQRLVLES